MTLKVTSNQYGRLP